jgi:hypothetical protein
MCIARFSLRRGEVWIQSLKHRATTSTKHAKKATSIENKDNKVRRPRVPNPTN